MLGYFSKKEKHMIKSDYERRLKDGIFEDIDFEEWFSDFNVDLIEALIEGLKKSFSPALMSLVILYSKRYEFIPSSIEHPRSRNYIENKLLKYASDRSDEIRSAKDLELSLWWDSFIRERCDRFLMSCIKVATLNSNYQSIVKELAYHPEEKVRLCYCANISYEEFLDDPSPCIQRMAFIKRELEERFASMEIEDKKRVRYLAACLEYGAIHFTEIAISGANESIMVDIQSALFKQSLTVPNFDAAVLYMIEDKRVLASYLNEYIKNGSLEFIDEVNPTCFSPQGETI